MRLKIFRCWLAFVFSPFLNFLFTSFACTSNVFINSTNTYGVLLWTEMFVSSPNSCWNPQLQCDAIRRWGLWEVIRFRWGHESGGLMRGLGTWFRSETQSCLCPLCEDIARRQLSASREEGSHQNATMLATWSWIS